MKPEYKAFVEQLITLAIQEDIGDERSFVFVYYPIYCTRKMQLLVKQDGVLAGVEIAKMVFERLDSGVKFEQIMSDGDKIKVGDIVFM